MPQPLYAIGDIHGQIDMLTEALARIHHHGGVDAKIVFVGDLVDRGPDSRAVIDLLITGQAQGRNWIALKGNHDRLFADFLTDGTTHSPLSSSGASWLSPRMGGDTTLASYGVTVGDPATTHAAAIAAIPPEHQAFIHALPTYHIDGNLLFVHAGIRPGIALADQSEDDLIWIREPFHSYLDPHPWLVVHGHASLDAPCHYGNRVNIDSGAGHGRLLTAALFDDNSVSILTATGPIPLRPT